MTKIYSRKQIESAIDIPYLIAELEKGLMLFSQKQTCIAPSSFLHFDAPPADVHIKSGAICGDDFFVIKVASGFYDNPKINLPSSNGLMLLFSQKTGELKAILLDEGRLTDLRTALAGAIAAKHLAPHPITKIGLLGTGTQAREQLLALQYVTICRDVLVWGRNVAKAAALADDPRLADFKIAVAEDVEEITQSCNLIVTATAASQPLLFGHQLRPGTHITAVGTDDYGKQELDATVFNKANLIVADSLEQCSRYGDLAHMPTLDDRPIMELGALLLTPQARSEDDITIADLTGVAIEDLQIAKAIYHKLESSTWGSNCCS